MSSLIDIYRPYPQNVKLLCEFCGADHGKQATCHWWCVLRYGSLLPVVIAIGILLALAIGCGPAPHMPQRGTALFTHSRPNAFTGSLTYQVYVERKLSDGSHDVVVVDVPYDVWKSVKVGDEILY